VKRAEFLVLAAARSTIESRPTHTFPSQWKFSARHEALRLYRYGDCRVPGRSHCRTRWGCGL